MDLPPRHAGWGSNRKFSHRADVVRFTLAAASGVFVDSAGLVRLMTASQNLSLARVGWRGSSRVAGVRDLRLRMWTRCTNENVFAHISIDAGLWTGSRLHKRSSVLHVVAR